MSEGAKRVTMYSLWEAAEENGAGWSIRSDKRNAEVKKGNENQLQARDGLEIYEKQQNKRSNKYRGSSEEGTRVWACVVLARRLRWDLRGFSGWWHVFSDSISILRRSPWFHPASSPAEMARHTWRRWRRSDQRFWPVNRRGDPGSTCCTWRRRSRSSLQQRSDGRNRSWPAGDGRACWFPPAVKSSPSGRQTPTT